MTGQRRARFLGIMAEQAARMNRLIDDLLSLSRIEISEHLPPLTVIDRRRRRSPGWRTVLESLRLAERGQTLALADRRGRSPPRRSPTRTSSIQVLENLLDNAMQVRSRRRHP